LKQQLEGTSPNNECHSAQTSAIISFKKNHYLLQYRSLTVCKNINSQCHSLNMFEERI